MTIIRRNLTRDMGNGLGSLKRNDAARKDLKKESREAESKVLSEIKERLELAAKYQPCPACKHDIETLIGFLEKKALALESGEEFHKKNLKALDSIDFVNEITGVGMRLTRLAGPFTNRVNAPKLYEEVLKNDIEPNKKVKVELEEAAALAASLPRELEYVRTAQMLRSFIKAVDFKLSIDPTLFYVFDKAVRLGYKTHIWDLVGSTIVAFKKVKRRIEE